MTILRVLLAEDDTLAQRAISAYLARSTDLRLVATAPDGRVAVQLARTYRPDVAIVDINLPGIDGIEVTRQITAPEIGCRVVCFTALSDDLTMTQALAAGASGFLLKTDSPGLIQHGLRAAYHGDSLVSPQLVTRLLRGKQDSPGTPPPDLNATEIRLINLVGQGLSNAEVADELFLAPSTVKNYVSKLLVRFELKNRTALAAKAHDWGLGNP